MKSYLTTGVLIGLGLGRTCRVAETVVPETVGRTDMASHPDVKVAGPKRGSDPAGGVAVRYDHRRRLTTQTSEACQTQKAEPAIVGTAVVLA